MLPVELQVTGEHAQLYRAVLDEAVNEGQTIMEALIRTARRALHDREKSVRIVREREALAEARQYLNKHEAVLVSGYPQALQTAFAKGNDRAQTKALGSVHFDQLELMDEQQIMERVELARAEQKVTLVVELSLAGFNQVMCAAAGLQAVRADQNPVRPELYVLALQAVVKQIQLTATVREILMGHMSEALGATLAALYDRLATQLRAQGVRGVGYAMRPTSAGFDGEPFGQAGHRVAAAQAQAKPVDLSPQAIINAQSGVANETRVSRAARKSRSAGPHDETLLTLDKLRQLLSGEFEQAAATPTVESFAARFSREFDDAARDSEPVPADFDATVPAAFEALKELKQIDQVIERIGSRNAARIEVPEPVSSSLNAVRSTLRRSSQGLGQALSLEVVALMVDNIANDEHLLGPVQDVIRSLEPALLRLALVDPRFFSDKQHPARRLLQEITQRSLAYDAMDAGGFDEFLDILQQAVTPLDGMQIEDAQPFEQVLHELVRLWDEKKQPEQLEGVMQTLQHAEERNLLAGKIAREIAARPDAGKIPTGVLDFLCGPWAQVLAHARLAEGAGSDDPGQYRELVFALIWSTQPELTRKNVSKLTRLVPKLLGKLREGLTLIGYPSLKTSAFFELLANLHQQVFKSLAKTAEPPQPKRMRATLFEAADSWIAPAEAKLSGFMEAPVEMMQSAQAASILTETTASVEDTGGSAVPMDQAVVSSADFSLPVGAWVELLVNGAWIRTQLSWASSHGTLFLFTSASGSTQSMTRRSRDKLMVAGTLRIISGQAVVDGALDAVVQTAMHNSIDIKL